MAKLRDVAVRAGVGVGTASRALSGRGYVDAQTRERIMAAAAELGYRPNAVARALREQKTRVVGLLLPDIANEFYTEAAETLQRELARARFQLIVSTSGNDPDAEERGLQALLDHQVDGIIHVPVDPALSLPDSVPLVQLNRHSLPLQADAVVSDDRWGIEQLTEWALAQGHRDIAFITGAALHSTSADRLDGFRRAVEGAELVEDAAPERRFRVLAGEFTSQWGREAMRSLLADLPTMVVAASSRIALGVIGECGRAGIDMPGDMSLAAHGTPEWYEAFHPAITAYAPPLAEMGHAAAAAILDKIEARDGAVTPEPSVMRMRGVLHRRESIAQPRQSDEYVARRRHAAEVDAALTRVVAEEAEVVERLKDA